MHANIDRILKRANALLLSAYHDPDAQLTRKAELVAAFAKLNQGALLQTARFPPAALPLDRDGSETVQAARFVAQAMGLTVMENTGLDGDASIGPGHLAILRCVANLPDPNQAQREARAAQAGMCIRVNASALEANTGLQQALSKRRHDDDPAGGGRQPSMF